MTVATEAQSHRGAVEVDGRREAAHATGFDPKHERLKAVKPLVFRVESVANVGPPGGPTHRPESALTMWVPG